eukprot:TRINITY_DN3682_c0_g5_i2.p1 TRINITY_DN3682_c0_g5~~TRINITY_DN3682_c0_g5_i2.p1  ORF type:complete len:284 (-),score=35.67 TRINITY_DN3682_c0_g5_i2:209-1018(-)
MERAIQRQELKSEEMDKAIKDILPCVDVETCTTHYSPSECISSETSSRASVAEFNLTTMTQMTPDMLLLVEDDVPLERSHTSSCLKECSHRNDNRTALILSNMIQVEGGIVDESTARRGSPTHRTEAPLSACQAEDHGTTSASTRTTSSNDAGPKVADRSNLEASRVSCTLQRSCAPTSVRFPMESSEIRAADMSNLLDDGRKHNSLWIDEDEYSSDDDSWSVDSGTDGPPPCRRSAYDIGYAHDVRLPASWRRSSVAGVDALRLLLSA